MQIDFFEKEVSKAQERFNQTYGQVVVCNLKARQAAIMSIIHLGMLCRKITNVKSKGDAKQDIQQFIRIRNTLTNHFKIIEHHVKERRDHGSINGRSDARGSGGLRKLRKCLQG